MNRVNIFYQVVQPLLSVLQLFACIVIVWVVYLTEHAGVGVIKV